MNGYERALRTLGFQEADCVPTWGGWILSAPFFEYITGKCFWDNPRAVAFEAYRKLEVDIVTQTYYLPASPAEWRAIESETVEGAEKFRSPEDVVAYVEALPEPRRMPIESRWKATQYPDFDFDLYSRTVLEGYERLQEELGPDILCMPSAKKTRFVWYSIFGYESFMLATSLYPDTMRELFQRSAEEARLFNSVYAELMRQGKMPACIFTGDDLCGNQGPMISPAMLRSLYFPALRYGFEPFIEIGAEILWHSDGNILPIAEDMIAAGVTGFQGFQEETAGFDVSQIASLRVRNGRKPLLMAGLSVEKTLPFGTVGDVKRDVERIIDTVGPGGGLVMGAANAIGPDCPDENIEALYRHTHEYSRGKLTG